MVRYRLEHGMFCVILAGGLGTRMRPHTAHLPKYLLPVDGTPFADHQLRWIAARGVTDVVLCIGEKGALVRDHVGDGARYSLCVRYSEDGPSPRGTAGALRAALDLLPHRFLVLYGDSFLPIEFRPAFDAFVAQGKPAMMTVLRNEGRWDQGNVRYEGGLVELYQKSPPAPMPYIDYGLSMFCRDVIEQRVPPTGQHDLATLQEALSREGLLAGFEVFDRFYEVGSTAGLKDFEEWLKRQQD